MKQEALTQFPMTWMTAAGLLLFFFSFSAILLWTYSWLKARDIDQASSMALSDGELQTLTHHDQKEG